MKKHIFVNNTAATSSGALTILKEFIQNVAKKSSKDYIYYIFCTADLKEFQSENIKIIDTIQAKAWKDRIKWDLYGMKNWSKENQVNPDLIISLQNTSVRGFKGVEQIVYLHQSIPYYRDLKWSILKKDERIYWFYKNIYKIIIHLSLKNNDVVVQSYWLKDLIFKEHNLKKDRIHVVKPTVNKIIEPLDKKNRTDNSLKLFYPATPHIYKNHKILLEALDIIKNKYKNLNIKLYLTIESNETNIANMVNSLGLNKEVIFIGHLSQERMYEMYNRVDVLVFPSCMETYGLPLIEAAYMKTNIVASNLNYAKEVLEGYNGALFADVNNAYMWAEYIIKSYKFNRENNELEISGEDSWKKFIKLIDKLI